MSSQKLDAARPPLGRNPSVFTNGAVNGFLTPLATVALHSAQASHLGNAVLELSDGSAFQGISFGANDKSISGECVFQTGITIARHEF